MNSMSGEKLKGVPYTGTLPAVLTGTKAGYLHKYKIYGNLSQNGTPAPSDPIYPSECGERTGNLFDADTIYSAYKQADGTYQGTVNNFYTLHPTPFTADDIGKEFTFAIKVNATTSSNIRASANVNGTSINGNGLSASGITKVTFTVSSTSDYLYLNYGSGGGNQINISDIMLNLGSTPLPYEPFGYKLPLLSGSTPVDIYLGESQTTRRIKKLVLTGEENIYSVTEATSGTAGLYAFVYRYDAIGMSDILNYNKHMASILYPVFLSSHFKMKTSDEYASYKNIKDGEMGANSSTGGLNIFLVLCKSGITTAGDFKTYLAQQYANGTPVTIWYILATEETSILNEPLRKIGDYADTIDSTQTTAQIPTTANSTTISWGGQGLAPSEFDSIQEWVDIPTYKRVNSEWVADN